MDSILFEDDGELEYFDVLNLLPLSNVRLEYDETDLRDGNFSRKNERIHGSRGLKILEYCDTNSEAEKASPSTSSNATDEEKFKEHTTKEDNSAAAGTELEKKLRESPDLSRETESIQRDTVKRDLRKFEESSEEDSEINSTNRFLDQRLPSSLSKLERDYYRANVENFVIPCEEDRKLEEIEDYKSIWISDGADQNKMSRRPQILKVIDNDVTRKHHRCSVVEIDAVVDDVTKNKKQQDATEGANERVDISAIKSNNNVNKDDEIRERNMEVSIRYLRDNIFMIDRKVKFSLS